MKWISVKDKLPDKDKTVLLYSEYNGITMGYRVTDLPPLLYGESDEHDREYMIMGYNAEIRSGITHWMELPRKP